MLASINKLNGTNYRTWKIQIESILLDDGLIGCLEEFVPRKSSGLESEAYEKNERKCKRILVMSMEDKCLNQVLGCRNSKEIWEKLAQLHEKRGMECRMSLQQEFYETKMQENESVTDYVSRVEDLFNRLESIDVAIPGSVMVDKIVCGLTKPYFNFVSIWQNVPQEQRTLGYLTQRLMSEERLIQKFVDKEEALALASEGLSKKSDKKAIWNSQRQKSNRKLNIRVSPRDKCFYCQKLGHWKKDCPELRDQAHGEAEAFTVEVGQDKEGDHWVVDLYAQEHMTYDPQEYFSYRKLEEPVIVSTGRDERVRAIGIGDIRLINDRGEKVIVKDVLHVPDVARKLFSLAATSRSGNNWIGYRDVIEVRTCKDKQVLIAKRQGALYIVKMGKGPEIGGKLDLHQEKHKDYDESGPSSLNAPYLKGLDVPEVPRMGQETEHYALLTEQEDFHEQKVGNLRVAAMATRSKRVQRLPRKKQRPNIWNKMGKVIGKRKGYGSRLQDSWSKADNKPEKLSSKQDKQSLDMIGWQGSESYLKTTVGILCGREIWKQWETSSNELHKTVGAYNELGADGYVNKEQVSSQKILKWRHKDMIKGRPLRIVTRRLSDILLEGLGHGYSSSKIGNISDKEHEMSSLEKTNNGWLISSQPSIGRQFWKADCVMLRWFSSHLSLASKHNLDQAGAKSRCSEYILNINTHQRTSGPIKNSNNMSYIFGYIGEELIPRRPAEEAPSGQPTEIEGTSNVASEGSLIHEHIRNMNEEPQESESLAKEPQAPDTEAPRSLAAQTSRRRKFVHPVRRITRPPPDNDGYYDVRCITGHKFDWIDGKMVQLYRVWWAGYSREESTWEPYQNLRCGRSIRQYHRRATQILDHQVNGQHSN